MNKIFSPLDEDLLESSLLAIEAVLLAGGHDGFPLLSQPENATPAIAESRSVRDTAGI
jgi:hypothetical protein